MRGAEKEVDFTTGDTLGGVIGGGRSGTANAIYRDWHKTGPCLLLNQGQQGQGGKKKSFSLQKF